MTRRPHQPGYDGCFACGTDIPLLRVVGGDQDGLVAVARPHLAHQGAPGRVHGGIVAALLDEAMSLALWRTLDRPAVTVRLETDFHAPMPIDHDVKLRASCTAVDGRKLRARAEALLDDRLLASATGLFIEMPDDHFMTGHKQKTQETCSDASCSPGGRRVGASTGRCFPTPPPQPSQ